MLIMFGRTKDAHETRPSGVWSKTGTLRERRTDYLRTDRLRSCIGTPDQTTQCNFVSRDVDRASVSRTSLSVSFDVTLRRENVVEGSFAELGGYERETERERGGDPGREPMFCFFLVQTIRPQTVLCEPYDEDIRGTRRPPKNFGRPRSCQEVVVAC